MNSSVNFEICEFSKESKKKKSKERDIKILITVTKIKFLKSARSCLKINAGLSFVSHAFSFLTSWSPG